MDSETKLEAIKNLISDYLASGKDMLMSSRRVLDKILEIASDEKQEKMEDTKETTSEQKIVISCDASIKTNPGGPAAVGVVIRWPDGRVHKFPKFTSAQTNNEAEYDAVYEGLMYIATFENRPTFPIEIRSDSQLVVKQLLGKYQINNAILQRKCSSINSLAAGLPVPIEMVWRPRNSTPDLTESNNLAQTALGVKLH